ncbi:MAG: hypothetical protein IKA10_07870 [Oscillospiraceae bacterium]|nr:hypothetical protein [Oscillospiraceae bacterium]
MCYNTVIPALFIFMVLTIFLSDRDIGRFIGIPFLPLFRLLKIRSLKMVSYCVLSILGGFATGGYFLNKAKEENICEDNAIGIMSILAGNNSPAFVITAVGTNMLGHFQSGIMLYFSILISSFITAFIFSFLYPYSVIENTAADRIEHIDFVYSLNRAVTCMINICGAVIFSYSVCKVISLYTENIVISSLFSAFFEVTTACKIITENIGNNLYFLCFALSICPLSTCLQLKGCGKSTPVSLNILLISKLVHIPLSMLILRTAVNLFPQSFAVYASGDINVNMYWNTPQLSCCFLILSICFVIFFDKKIGVFTKSFK